MSSSKKPNFSKKTIKIKIMENRIKKDKKYSLKRYNFDCDRIGCSFIKRTGHIICKYSRGFYFNEDI